MFISAQSTGQLPETAVMATSSTWEILRGWMDIGQERTSEMNKINLYLKTSSSLVLKFANLLQQKIGKFTESPVWAGQLLE